MNISDEKIIILDFGSQYTQLIARKVRELGVYSEIVPYNTDIGVLQESAVRAIILSGGPSSIYEDGAPHMDDKVFELGKPVLGICYGLQHLAYSLNGKVAPSAEREYGRAQLQMQTDSPLFADVASGSIVWMSHGDRLEALPDDFAVIARTENSPIAAIGDENRIFMVFSFIRKCTILRMVKKFWEIFFLKLPAAKAIGPQLHLLSAKLPVFASRLATKK
jgi:GMP synthase (glutamine-hydrolysing)